MILSEEVSGVLVEDMEISADVAQNNSFPMVVTRQALEPVLHYLLQASPGDTKLGILEWSQDKFSTE